MHRGAVKAASADGFNVDEFMQVFLGGVEALLSQG